jgi:magnesium chelatase family protein
MGELSLDGSLQPIKGALPIAIQARKEGYKGFILPMQNAREAAIVNDLEVYGVKTLSRLSIFLTAKATCNPKWLTPATSFLTA